MDFIIQKIEILQANPVMFSRGEVLSKYYLGYTVIDLGQYNQASGVWVLLEKDGNQIQIEFRGLAYIIHHIQD